MKKAIVLISVLVLILLVFSSCGKNVYKTEGTGADMHFESNFGKCNAVWNSIWELSYKTRQNVGSLDNADYLLYKDIYDSDSSIYKVEKYTSQSPYPKFFINEKFTFPDFKSEYIDRIRFLGVDSYDAYLHIDTSKKTFVSAIDKWDNIDFIKKLYNAVIKKDNKAEKYPGFEDYPKLGFLEWDCSENQSLQLLTDLIKINDQYFIIIRYGYEDQPRDLIQIDTDVAQYLLNHAKEMEIHG